MATSARQRAMWVGALALLLAGAAGGTWWVLRQRAQAAAPVVAATPTRPDPTFDAVGRIEAVKVVAVPVPVEGTIDQTLAEVGDAVSAGQPLARIRNDGLESARAAADAEAERAVARVSDLESRLTAARLEASRAAAEASRVRDLADRAEKANRRQEMLLREGATPRIVAEKAEREHAAAQTELTSRAALAKQAEERVATLIRDLDAAKKTVEEKESAKESAQAELAQAEVRAPADGVVTARRADAGAEVHRAMTDLFQIATDLTLLQIAVEVPPDVRRRVRPGLPALVRVVELGDTALSGAVRDVKGDQVTVEFTSPDPTVRPGLSGQVRIALP